MELDYLIRTLKPIKRESFKIRKKKKKKKKWLIIYLKIHLFFQYF